MPFSEFPEDAVPRRLQAERRWQHARAEDESTFDARRLAFLAIMAPAPIKRRNETLRAMRYCGVIVGLIVLVFWLHSS